MKLDGRELLVLQACRDLPKDQYDNVHDDEIARETRLPLPDVKAILESLDGRELVSKVRLSDDHYAAQITSNGILELSQRSPIPDGSKKSRIEAIPIKIVPKGLRSFDAEDQDFFLDLLPGPCRADGLPESIHFWKVRIEEMDPDKTFSVGVIFGPSGCGKSSLVKAGLLPRLSNAIIPIYVEATGEETEARLLRGLRKHNPNLPADLDLRTALVAAREKIREGSNKVLLVIDQFEQWYHAKGAEPETELANALSECDGGRVQAIILVRDDYSMALHRFMRDIGVRQNQDQNLAVVDLFDLQHARKVLIAFGRGYGMLPDDPKEMTGAQNEFVDRTIKGLSQEGRVVSVRLALFAEMLKGKPWTPETLKQVGGAEGVGVTFLEETFSARTAPPSYRIHQKAVQAVLKTLLPEAGSNIKGNMRSYDELRAVSGYGSCPNEFDELLRILNSELRLISPIEPEESESDGQTKTQVGERFFLLTHDYLVPSIREWLTRKQKETRRGQAELRLVERSALWNAKPENRRLPSLLEWTNIGLLTKKKDWTEPQRKMMRRAGRVHGLRTLALAALIALITWGGYEAYGSFQARALVDSLKTASTAEVPDIVKNLSGYYRWARRPLSDLLSSTEEQSSPHLHASLALLPVDPGQVEYLYNRMLNANPTELPVIREALSGHQWTLIERLWGVLENTQADRDQRFRAAWALAGYVADETEQRWVAASRFITDRLLASVIENPSSYTPLMEMLRPIRKQLLASLATTFRDPQRLKTERYFASNILADYASDQPNLLADLLMDADFKAYAAFFPIAQRQAAKTLPLFQAEIRKQATIPDSDKDSEMVKDRLAERQARAAITLLRMGKAGEIIPLLRHSADPRLRSFIVNWLK